MKKMLALMAGIILLGSNSYAGNGDLIVDGKLGVGTGTTAPADKLEVVNGSILATNQGNGGGKFGNVEVGYKGYYNTIRNTSGLHLNYDTNANVFLVGGTSTGNVGIGTTSLNAKLHVAGTSVFTNGTGDSWFPFVDGNSYISGTNLIFRSNGNYEKMRIDTNGNVGIGLIPAPAHKLDVGGGVWAYAYNLISDSQYKKDVQQINGALDKVNHLSGYSYLFKTDEYKDKGFPEGKQLGLIAQDVEKVVPEAVITEEDGSKSVNYSMIIPVLIEAIKEQQKKIEALEQKVK